MRPLVLTLRGFTGVHTGQGKDELRIDLESLPSDARLVALAGPNGAGKTTILDNLHPYRTMPSRAGADPFGAFSYYDHVRLPENLKELEFEHDGRRYKSSLVIRVNGKRKSEAYLHVMENGRWVPVRLGDGTVSDGKSEVYDRCIQELVGSPETFFTSVFSAQKRRPLSDYRNGEIKALMTDLLGLNEVRRMGVKAADVGKQLRSGLAARRAEDSTLRSRIEAAAAEGAKVADCQHQLAAAVDDRIRAGEALAEAQSAVAHLHARAAIARESDTERTRLDREIRRCEGEREVALNHLAANQARERAHLLAARAAIDARHKARDTALSAARQQLAAASKLVATAGAVEQAAARLPRWAHILERCVRRRDAARVAVESASRLSTLLTSIDREIAAIEREAGAAELKARDLRKRLALTNEVPCAGTDLQDRCRLLTDAHEARPLVPSADALVARLAGSRTELKERRQLTVVELERIGPAADRLALCEEHVSWARAGQRNAELLAARGGEIERAKQAMTVAEASIREISASPEAEPAELLSIAALEHSMLGHASQMQVAQQQAVARLSGLSAALKAIPAGPGSAELKVASDQLEAAQRRLNESQDAVARAVERHTRAEAAAVDAACLQSEAMQRAALERSLEAEISVWSSLADALSNDGVVALAIDEAGPALTRIANDLLEACYGPRFSVSIRTQIANAKGDLREGFDVVVFDGCTGEDKSVSVMSGGESVWINEALTRAIALYLARVTGRRFSTLFCDEVDGPLDPDHKRSFMAMKRKVLELGGYEREFFVSQTPELAAMADAVIDLSREAEAVS